MAFPSWGMICSPVRSSSETLGLKTSVFLGSSAGGSGSEEGFLCLTGLWETRGALRLGMRMREKRIMKNTIMRVTVNGERIVAVGRGGAVVMRSAKVVRFW